MILKSSSKIVMKGNEMLDGGLNHQPRRPGNLEFSTGGYSFFLATKMLYLISTSEIVKFWLSKLCDQHKTFGKQMP